MWLRFVLAVCLVCILVCMLSIARSALGEHMCVRKNTMLAIVSGAFGKGKNQALMVTRAYKNFDCFFVTDNLILADKAHKLGWHIIWSFPDYNADDSYNAAFVSKKLKTNTQNYLPPGHHYKYVMWVDSKQRIRTEAVLKFLLASKPFCAAAVPHNFLHSASEEFREAMLQERYRRDERRLRVFMRKQAEQGYPSDSNRVHYLTGFLIWNLTHPQLTEVQSLWQSYISEIGIECQISFYYVAQRHRDIIVSMPKAVWRR